MKELIWKLCVRVRIFGDENGQDLIEYALTAALIALAATVAMGGVASSISLAFGNIGSKLSTAST